MEYETEHLLAAQLFEHLQGTTKEEIDAAREMLTVLREELGREATSRVVCGENRRQWIDRGGAS